MELADEIVVINKGVVEQVGTPDEVYDEPANGFVMRFIGPATRFGGRLVRPHDLVLAKHPEAGAAPATVLRVLRLGFEARVDVRTAEEEDVWVQLTRGDADELDVQAGDRVFVRTPPDVGIGALAVGG